MNIFTTIKKKLFSGNNEDRPLLWNVLSGSAEFKGKNNFLVANIRAIATAACNGQLKLKNADGTEIPYTKKGENILLDLLFQPSPFFNETVFKQILIAHMLIHGDAYILKTARDLQGRPSMLIPIPAPSVSTDYDGRGYPAGYHIQTVNGKVPFGLEDIIHIYEGNAEHLFKGISRVKLCGLDADVMNSAKVFNLAYFKNGASVGGIISFPEAVRLKPEEQQTILRAFNDLHSGSVKAHRTAILAQGGKYESFKTSHKDMEFSEGQRFAQQQIYSTMGVPPALVGLFEYAPQFNTKEQQKIFYETNIIPMMSLVSDALNEHLVGDFYKDESVYLEYDFSKVKALEQDWLAKAQAMQILAQRFPINEVKRALDLPFSDVLGGDEAPDPVMTAFSNLQAPVKDTKKVRLVRPTPAQMRKHKRDKEALFGVLGKGVANVMKTHFEFQHQALKKWVRDNPGKVVDFKGALGSQNEQAKKLLILKMPIISSIFNKYLTFEQGYIQSLLPQKDFLFMAQKDLNSRVQQWVEEYAFRWAETIEATTFNQLDDLLRTLTMHGVSTDEINDAVLAFFTEQGYLPGDSTNNAETVYSRVKTIVQTETLATMSEAAKESYKSTPFVGKKGWIATMGVSDHHKGHEEMDGQEVGINERFYNAEANCYADAPGQFGRADQDINCLCDMYPIVEDY
ncbi:MAG: phage portal protein [Elusimicrobiaceae bacterium]|nr:phage portal protein [Elusimicrobiaceae bacterium]